MAHRTGLHSDREAHQAKSPRRKIKDELACALMLGIV
jgi:hypothetical protein